jgi:hypothetical protein
MFEPNKGIAFIAIQRADETRGDLEDGEGMHSSGARTFLDNEQRAEITRDAAGCLHACIVTLAKEAWHAGQITVAAG